MKGNAMKKMKPVYIVKYVDKETLWGPFKTANEAAAWANDNLTGNDWCIQSVSY